MDVFPCIRIQNHITIEEPQLPALQLDPSERQDIMSRQPLDYVRLGDILFADLRDTFTLESHDDSSGRHIYSVSGSREFERKLVMIASLSASDLYLAAREHLFDLIQIAKERDALRALKLFCAVCQGCAIHGPERPHWHCLCGSRTLDDPTCTICRLSVIPRHEDDLGSTPKKA